MEVVRDIKENISRNDNKQNEPISDKFDYELPDGNVIKLERKYADLFFNP